jgi:predicted dienelactone hydrolase
MARRFSNPRLAGVAIAAATLSIRVAGAAAVYDPLQVAADPVRSIELVAESRERERKVPLRAYLPTTGGSAPVVLFSHGLGGSRENNAYLGEHWARRGYVAVFLQHAGSDEAVWRDAAPGQREQKLREAASPKSFLQRVRDVHATLDALEGWQRSNGHALSGRLDLARIGMSGHSFGAITTQAVSGQKSAVGQDFNDSRIRAAVMMSPSPPMRKGVDPKTTFGDVKTPWLLLTGTEDDSPIGDISPARRLEVYPALPAGGKYELVLFGARHTAFGDRPLAADRGIARNPNHHRVVLALTTAFWDAWLRGDAAARAWLDGDGPRSVLEARDRWQRK